MGKAHLNPLMVRWAVDRAGAQPSELAKAFKKDPETIMAWMEGSEAPTFKQAQALAKGLHVPFGYLFLESPPEETLSIRDFRRTQGAEHPEMSLDLHDVISDVLRKQDWYRDHRIDNAEHPLDLEFVGLFASTASAKEIARDIRDRLNFERKVRPKSKKDDFLREFVSQVEELGVLVMRSGIVGQFTKRPLKIEEFRGFSIADPIAPVIFVNSVDSPSTQTFTLAHELAHIWIGQGGISDADPAIPRQANGDIEDLCNEVAGEVLLPWSQLYPRYKQWNRHSESASEARDNIAQEFHVSTIIVARQLWVNNLMKDEPFFELYEQEREKWSTYIQGSSGWNYYRTLLLRNSKRFTKAVLESMNSSEILIRDASRLLGIKPKNLRNLQERVTTL